MTEMSQDRRSRFAQTRWWPAIANGIQDIPQFSAVHIAGVTFEDTGTYSLRVKLPVGEDASTKVVNQYTGIVGPGGLGRTGNGPLRGLVTLDYPAIGVVRGSPLSVGQYVGAGQSGEWGVSPNATGYVLLARVDGWRWVNFESNLSYWLIDRVREVPPFATWTATTTGESVTNGSVISTFAPATTSYDSAGWGLDIAGAWTVPIHGVYQYGYHVNADQSTGQAQTDEITFILSGTASGTICSVSQANLYDSNTSVAGTVLVAASGVAALEAGETLTIKNNTGWTVGVNYARFWMSYLHPVGNVFDTSWPAGAPGGGGPGGEPVEPL